MDSGKPNCWEFESCECKSKCSVFIESRTNNVHEGKNGGRCCWMINETLCNGKKQSTLKDKYRNCSKCEFFLMVHTEYGGKLLSIDQIGKLLS